MKYVNFSGKNGLFMHPGVGARRIAAGYQRLAPGKTFSQTVGAGAEVVVFVWKGAVRVSIASASQTAGEKDAVFAQGPATLELRNALNAEAIFVHALAPPEPSR